MPRYTQTKTTNEGKPGKPYQFVDNDMKSAIERVKEVVPTLSTYYNAEIITLASDDPSEELVVLKKGTDF